MHDREEARGHSGTEWGVMRGASKVTKWNASLQLRHSSWLLKNVNRTADNADMEIVVTELPVFWMIIKFSSKCHTREIKNVMREEDIKMTLVRNALTGPEAPSSLPGHGRVRVSASLLFWMSCFRHRHSNLSKTNAKAWLCIYFIVIVILIDDLDFHKTVQATVCQPHFSTAIAIARELPSIHPR